MQVTFHFPLHIIVWSGICRLCIQKQKYQSCTIVMHIKVVSRGHYCCVQCVYVLGHGCIIMQFYNISYVCMYKCRKKENCFGNSLMSISSYPLIIIIITMKYQKFFGQEQFCKSLAKGFISFSIA